MAHRTIALTTELMEPCRREPEHIRIIQTFSWRDSFLGLVAFQETWLHRTLPGSFSVVRGGLVGREQGAGQKSHRGAIGFWGCWPFGDLATQNALPGFFFCGREWLCRAWARHRQKILPWRNRILGLVAFRRPGYTERASRLLFLWWGMAYKVWAGHKPKILPWRNRILGLVALQET